MNIVLFRDYIMDIEWQITFIHLNNYAFISIIQTNVTN